MAALFFPEGSRTILKFRVAESKMRERKGQISSKTETSITSNGNCLLEEVSKLLTEKLILVSNVIDILKILNDCSEFLGRDADVLSP